MWLTLPATGLTNLAAFCTAADDDAKAPSFKEGRQQPLLEPFKLADFELSTRMVYAPLTRCRGLDNLAQVGIWFPLPCWVAMLSIATVFP